MAYSPLVLPLSYAEVLVYSMGLLDAVGGALLGMNSIGKNRDRKIAKSDYHNCLS